jgi:hypothetical protein
VFLAERRVSGPLPRVPRRQPPQGGLAPYLRRFAEARLNAPVVLKEDENPTTFGAAVFRPGREAVVMTDNKGSRDYAIDSFNALILQPATLNPCQITY